MIIDKTIDSKFFVYYSHSENENILIIDIHKNRYKFLINRFKSNHLKIECNLDNIIKYLQKNTPDFIMIDFDLENDERSDKVIKYIIQRKICMKTKFLIHSNDELSINKLFVLLYDERDVEKCRLEDIIATSGDNDNA